MPYLRFTRDRRGYENTYLLHTSKRRGRDRPTLLYWYRTPPHVKVGRPAFDPEAIRLLEDMHPDLEFDWPQILEARPRPPEPEPRPGSDLPRRPRRATRVSPPPRPATERPAARPPALPVAVPGPAEPSPPVPAGSKETDPQPAPAVVPVRQPSRFVRVFDAGADPLPAPPAEDRERPHRASDPSAAEQVVGVEALVRLRARYAELVARIERMGDPTRQQALRELSESVNPDSWVTEAEVKNGLENLEDRLRDLHRMTGRRRRRRRGPRREEAGGAGTLTEEGAAAPPEQGGSAAADVLGPADEGDD